MFVYAPTTQEKIFITCLLYTTILQFHQQGNKLNYKLNRIIKQHSPHEQHFNSPAKIPSSEPQAQ